MKSILIILAAMLLLSCTFAEDQQDEKITRLVYSVSSVSVVNSNPEQPRVRVQATVPTPCYSFDHADVRTGSSSDTVFVSVVAKTDPDINCVQVLGTISAEFSMPLPGPGSYLVRFLGRSSNLDTLLTFPR